MSLRTMITQLRYEHHISSFLDCLKATATCNDSVTDISFVSYASSPCGLKKKYRNQNLVSRRVQRPLKMSRPKMYQ